MGRRSFIKRANRSPASDGKGGTMTGAERKAMRNRVRLAFKGIIMAIGVMLIVCGFFRRLPENLVGSEFTEDESLYNGRRLGNQANSSASSEAPLVCQQVPANKADLPDWWKSCTAIPGSPVRGKPYIQCLQFWHDEAYKCPDAMDDTRSYCSYYYHCSDMASYPGAAVDPFGPGIIVYILGALYTFAGLAVVCDEYFVPALEVLAERLDISDDVAGATLMAAGGSAPELATSIMGLFVARTDVGFSTIVGSAVFNVLFVIGMCALASPQVLVLTGWPLTRDSLYYSVTLLVLAMVYRFGTADVKGNDLVTGQLITLERSIEHWEALLQFSLYFGYVGIMYNNQRLKTAFYAYLERRKAKYALKGSSVKPTGSTGGTNGTAIDPDDDVATAAHRHADGDIRKLNSGQPQVSFRNRRKDDARKKASTRFRVGVLDILMGNGDHLSKLRVQAVAGFLGDVNATFDQFDLNRDGTIDEKELASAMRMLLGFDPGPEDMAKALSEIVTDETEQAGGKYKISRDEFETWYMKSEMHVMTEMHRVFKAMDTNGDGRVGEEEFKSAMHNLGNNNSKPMTEEELAHGLHLFAGDDAEISFDEFSEWYKTTILYTHQLSDHKKAHIEQTREQEDEEDEGGVSLMPPDGWAARINWFLLLPITGPLYFTVPDVRWASGKFCSNYQKCYPATFTLAIIWIALYSFFMVWFITCLGDLLGLSQEVMGVTFLAAGTSVPDLISSVIVAKEGHGDMAVSSSIGSNIFDVTVGLPFPWILHHFVYGPVQLNSKGSLFFSLLLLFGMLIAVLCIIIASSYRMTKALGISMFLLYFIFIAIDLLRNSGVITVDW